MQCLQQPFPSNGFNSGDFSVFRTVVLLSQPPVQNSSQLSNRLQRHLFSASLAELNSTELDHLAWGPRYIAQGRTQQKTLPPTTVFLLLLWTVAMAIARISLTCLPAVTKQPTFLLAIVA
jgi:hypothetical protein